MTENKSQLFPRHIEILRKLGQGGTAEIFLAHTTGANRPQVIKLFSSGTTPALAQRELAIAQHLNFPGALRLFEQGITRDGRSFLRMEYCPGPTLEEFINKIDEPGLLSLLSALATSLTVFHATGMAHNDIKPANIFVPDNMSPDDLISGRLYYLKLFDLSLACPFQDKRDKSGTGTVGFMSPEMILGRAITPASDIFSAGVMAYYLACGEMPFGFPDSDPLEVNARTTEGERPAFTGNGGNFSEAIRELIYSMLSINPDNRPPSAFALQELLAKTGSVYPFRKAVRPRYLLDTIDDINIDSLRRSFGADSFSDDQLDYLHNRTAWDKGGLRLILEYNYNAGNFARLDGHWGWRSEDVDAINLPPLFNRFALRPLAGKSLTQKKAAMALAVTKGVVIPNIPDDPGWLNEFPDARRGQLIASLNKCLSDKTKGIIARRLLDSVGIEKLDKSLAGRLCYLAGQYDRAIEYFNRAADEYGAEHRHRDALLMLESGAKAATEINAVEKHADIILKKARIHKEQGDLQAARKSYDELTALIVKNGPDEMLATAYKEQGDVYKALSDYSSGIEVLNQARKIYEQNGNSLGLSHVLNNLGNMHWVVGDLDQARHNYEAALEIQEEAGAQKYIASTLNNIGNIHTLTGNYEKSLEYFKRSLTIKKELEDQGEIARTLNNIGVTYYFMGMAGRASDSFESSLKINQQIGNQVETLVNMENLTDVMILAGRLTQALTYLKEGSGLAEKLGDELRQAIFSGLTGKLWRRMGYYPDAEESLNQFLELASARENRQLQLTGYIDYCRLHRSLREFDNAEKYMRLAEDVAEKLGDKNALYHIQLMKLEDKFDDSLMKDVNQLLTELNTAREKALYHLAMLEILCGREDLNEADHHLIEAGKFFTLDKEDIDLARFEMARAGFYRLKDHTADAVAGYEKALKQATNIGLMPESWQSAAALSTLYFEQRELQQSFSYATRAIDTLKKMSARFADNSRLGRLYNDPRIIDLFGRIKSIKAVLVKS